MTQYRNVFEALEHDGHDENFVPRRSKKFQPTEAAPGTGEKLDELRTRVAMGLPLWHEADRSDYSDLIAPVPPRHI
jgi:hypothetical protein